MRKTNKDIERGKERTKHDVINKNQLEKRLFKKSNLCMTKRGLNSSIEIEKVVEIKNGE